LDQTKDKINVYRGFCERTLNVRGFLSYLDQNDGFRLATTIYVPCENANQSYYRDVKAICPAMTALVHKTWIMMNGNVE
jgi:hypothetical protein